MIRDAQALRWHNDMSPLPRGREYEKDSLDFQASLRSAAEGDRMDVVYRRCCGLDIHKQTVVACLLLLDEAGRKTKKKREFGTFSTTCAG